MKKRQLVSALAAVMATSVVLTACGSSTSGTASDSSSQKKEDLSKNVVQTLKATNPGQNPDVAKQRKDSMVIGVEAWDDGAWIPYSSDSSYNLYVWETTFDTLLDADDQGQPKEGLASYDISKDGLTYTFKIKSGVKFSDGTDLTADDVAFSIMYYSDHSYKGYTDYSTPGIVGWDDFNSGKAQTISGMKVVDKNTITFKLEKPNASAIYALGGTLVMPKEYYGKNYKVGDVSGVDALKTQPAVGSGEYVMKTIKPGQELDLVANPNYRKGAPKIKNLIFKVTTEDNRIQMLKSGETDLDEPTVTSENVDQLTSAGFVNQQIFPFNGYGHIVLNFDKPLFKDQKVRQALVYGLDRKDIVTAVYGKYATVLNEPQSKAAASYNPDVNSYAFDTAKANKLLDEAGWKKGSDGIRQKDGVKFEIHYLASSPNPVNDKLIPIAKKNYAALGIKFSPESMDFPTIKTKMHNGQFDMVFLGAGLVADPDQTITYKTGAAQNNGHYSNSEVDKLLKSSLTEMDKNKRNDNYKKLWKTLSDDVAEIYVYQRSDEWAINSRIQGISTTPYKDFTVDLWKAEIK